MELALYRGRGAEIVLVHASMRPPRCAEQRHGPLRYLDTVNLDGTVFPETWPRLAEQLERQAFAVVDEADGLPLLGRAVTPSPSSIHPG